MKKFWLILLVLLLLGSALACQSNNFSPERRTVKSAATESSLDEDSLQADKETTAAKTEQPSPTSTQAPSQIPSTMPLTEEQTSLPSQEEPSTTPETQEPSLDTRTERTGIGAAPASSPATSQSTTQTSRSTTTTTTKSPTQTTTRTTTTTTKKTTQTTTRATTTTKKTTKTTTAPTTATTDTRVKPDTSYPYVASQYSKVFHKTSCGIATSINVENRVYFEKRQEAIDWGLTPCKICKP